MFKIILFISFSILFSSQIFATNKEDEIKKYYDTTSKSLQSYCNSSNVLDCIKYKNYFIKCYTVIKDLKSCMIQSNYMLETYINYNNTSIKKDYYVCIQSGKYSAKKCKTLIDNQQQ